MIVSPPTVDSNAVVESAEEIREGRKKKERRARFWIATPN
jgi:hypothetical protein